MYHIKFKNRFKKMPQGIEYFETWVVKVLVIDREDLTEDQICQDTETVDRNFYLLPQGKLIHIILWTMTAVGGRTWNTFRKWSPEKEVFYRGFVGKQIGVVIL